MTTADVTADKITIATEFRDKELIRQVPGARWDADARLWTVPLSWTSCKMLRAVFGDRLEITQDLADWAWQEHSGRIEPAMARRAEAMDPAHWNDERYGFQPSAVDFFEAATGAICADEMGTGKTRTTVLALEQLGDKAYPALIVCPASVKRQWAREFAETAPGRTVQIIAGTAAKRRTQLASGADVIVMNYDLLRQHSKLQAYGSYAMSDTEKTAKELQEIEFATVVADEAHKIKDAKSKQSRALKAAAGDATYRYALTGTPIANRPDEIWSLLNFIAPREWPSKTRFTDRYCLTSFNGFGTEVLGIAPQTKEEFFEVIDTRFLRRPIDLVLPYLPQITHEVREVEMGPKQKKAYLAMEDSFIAEVEGGHVMATSPLTQATRLCQFASASVEIVGNGEVRMQGPSNKVDGLVDVLEDLEGEQVVVFAEHRQLIDLAAARLTEKGVSFGRITGAENEAQRDAALQAFKRGELRVMLLTLGAGGTGIDGLQVARVAVFLERSWSMVQNKQAEGRLRRGGQAADSVLVIDLVSPGTIEEYRMERLAMKDAALEEIVRDKATLASFLKQKGAA